MNFHQMRPILTNVAALTEYTFTERKKLEALKSVQKNEFTLKADINNQFDKF